MATNNFTTITIDGIDISNYSQYYVINHITKKEEPTRTVNFALSNINDINQIEIPEILIKFKYIPIELYRQLFKATRKAEFKVVYYDQDYDEIRTNMFYLKEPSSINPHSWGANRYQNKNKAFLGFKDYSLDLVCTMNPISDLDIKLKFFQSIEEGEYIDIEKPYVINVFKNDSVLINFKITNLLGSALSGDIILSFSNDDVSVKNMASSSGRYTISCSSSGTEYEIDISKVKLTGDVVMFMTINNLIYNNENYGSLTISARIVIK